MTKITAAHETDIRSLVALNNRFAPSGLTLTRTEEFAHHHLPDYRVLRDADGGILGCVALDEYSPSVCELISLAIVPEAHGLGYGRVLINAAVQLATRREYAELFALSYSDELFLSCGFERVPLSVYPEKIARYEKIDRTEIQMGEKHCFRKRLTADADAPPR
ncbi:MAG: GNAT family N-acetyltransferase [Gemmatimonadaceae bacterium]|nr:GNAT family N-acetyltransferase [Gemmatimonadaceae bacterium]